MTVTHAGRQVNRIDLGSIDVDPLPHLVVAPHPGDLELWRNPRRGGLPISPTTKSSKKPPGLVLWGVIVRMIFMTRE
jgi:hypothetical protein